MKHNIYIYILVMFAVTYLIRVLPLTLIRKEIKNKTIRSILAWCGRSLFQVAVLSCVVVFVLELFL